MKTSTTTTLDLLLHPLRLRIIQMLFGGRQLTVRQMVAAQPDVPQATLYRHLHQLVEGGILVVAEERQVRNMTEKVYALASANVYLDPADTVDMGRGQLLGLFTAFAALLLNDFQRYIEGHDESPIDFKREGVTFGQRSLALSDAEAQELLDAIDAVLASFAGRPADSTRRRRLVSLVMMPGEDVPGVGAREDSGTSSAPKSVNRDQH